MSKNTKIWNLSCGKRSNRMDHEFRYKTNEIHLITNRFIDISETKIKVAKIHFQDRKSISPEKKAPS